MSQEFEIITRVRKKGHIGTLQSCSISTLHVVNAATMSTHPNVGVKMLYHLEGPLVDSRTNMMGEVCVSDLEYAYNMALMSESMDALKEDLRVFNNLCVGKGLTISAGKTKTLSVCPVCTHSSPSSLVQLGDGKEHVEVVEVFEYLCSTISQNC